ncbi:TonB-dependent receptor [Pedobacter puniceum]|uniref:TonB-dependent receptor n=1 Tax=Pedobacter puniceum TaxID=2666136 RepID=A0A7K0FQR3_9SPHI|nr:TonB-dependent receptor [Pedobacter puniceum]MRX48309.1 TonB-dependent receptor [Pedobacter puniceum]
MKNLFILSFLIFPAAVFAQKADIYGRVFASGMPVKQAIIKLDKSLNYQITDSLGIFHFKDVTPGEHNISVSLLGYKNYKKSISVKPDENISLEIQLNNDDLGLNEVVVSATRYGVSRKEAPVVVNVIGAKLFNATQSLSLSEGLNYQPGVRLENNCQNCGFTQVRLNGLEGAYSQVLINSRPIFSALSSVYGLDQIPTSMIERVEVVRSGGSALFGSNAIAGTINIITKDPILNSWEIGSNIALIDRKTPDHVINFNGSLAAEDLKSGATFYGMFRNRSPFDANLDGFTEITRMENNTFGGKAFLKPSDRSKITLDFSAINEFRRGGDRLHLAPQFTDITEQLNHQILLGGLTFDQYSKNLKNKYSAYISTQRGKRNSYYGGLGGSYTAIDSTRANNAYGFTDDISVVGGFQFTKNLENTSVFVMGAELQHNQVDDEIAGYNRLINQSLTTLGLYAQYEWKPNDKLTALLGSRYDLTRVNGNYTLQNIFRSSNLNKGVLSPRFTLLYKFNEDWQFRGGYARGFRAPQAFNEDMHISSAAGEQRFVILSENLKTEFSDAFTASLSYACTWGNTQVSFLTEGFYTTLKNQFVTINTGTSLGNGTILEEVSNGEGAYVSGANFELNIVPSAKFNLQAGGTWQKTAYNTPQVIYDNPDDLTNTNVSITEFLRTPRSYGYLNSNYKATQKLSFDMSAVYTGNMTAARIINANGLPQLINTPRFLELNLKNNYQFKLKNIMIDCSLGVQNIFNSFQKDFDTGPTRDSDYVYGPARPRTFYLGFKFRSL